MTPIVAVDSSTYLGPARIADVQKQRVRLAFPDQQVWAQMALAFHHQPRPGDVVLAIGQDESWFVIGVLEARGDTVLRVPGNLRLEAPNGKIELCSAEEITLASGRIRMLADRLELVASMLYEKFSTATRWVMELFHLRVGAFRTQVRSTYRLKAERIDERAEKDIHLDGDKIHLG
jgi:hypothetical protein